MRSILIKNIVLALVYMFLVVLMILLAKLIGHIYSFGYMFKVSGAILFIVSFIINVKSITFYSKYLNYILSFVVSIAITVLSGYIAIIIAVNCFISIGGQP